MCVVVVVCALVGGVHFGSLTLHCSAFYRTQMPQRSNVVGTRHDQRSTLR